MNGFRVWGLGFSITNPTETETETETVSTLWGLGFRVQGLGFRV